ncbi:MAG: transglycosylase SLT domain-containing protein [Desulfobacterales bacterium]
MKKKMISALVGVLLAWSALVACAAGSNIPTGSAETATPPGEGAAVPPNAPPYNDAALPPAVALCGEPLPLEDRQVWERLDREFTIAVWNRAQVFLWLKRAGRYFPYIEAKLAAADMPEDLKYLAVAESDLQSHVRSPAGAMGTWQFMDRTARRHGLKKNQHLDERRDFERSTAAALSYLQALRRQFGSWTLAMAAYNCGENRVALEISEQRVSDYYRLDLPLETERYIFRIAAIKVIIENPERYGYRIDPTHVYAPRAVDTVTVSLLHPVQIADLAQGLGTDFKVIKELNGHIRGHQLPVGCYTLNLPAGNGGAIAPLLQDLARSEAKPKTGTSIRHHVVQAGETLSHISKVTGVSLAQLRQLNGIDGGLIRAGQKILITP